MPWRRYRIGLAIAVPLGIAIGLGLGALLETLPFSSTPGAIALTGAVLGGIDATAAVGGALVAIRIRTVLQPPPQGLSGVGALGAATGSVVPWVVLGATGSSSSLALLLLAPTALICALVSGVLAALTIKIDEIRTGSRRAIR